MILCRQDILKCLRSQSDLFSFYGIKKMALFGSAAKNQLKEDSDIDILIEFHSNYETFDNYMDLKLILQDLFNKKVDLVIQSCLKERIREEILSEALDV